jgi:hypothetical protein
MYDKRFQKNLFLNYLFHAHIMRDLTFDQFLFEDHPGYEITLKSKFLPETLITHRSVHPFLELKQPKRNFT